MGGYLGSSVDRSGDGGGPLEQRICVRIQLLDFQSDNCFHSELEVNFQHHWNTEEHFEQDSRLERVKYLQSDLKQRFLQEVHRPVWKLFWGKGLQSRKGGTWPASPGSNTDLPKINKNLSLQQVYMKLWTVYNLTVSFNKGAVKRVPLKRVCS